VFCRFCQDYDLCGKCENKKPAVHDVSHVLLKMPLPIDQVKLDRAVIDGVMNRVATCAQSRFAFQHQFCY
jgi:hypothetical protein